MINPFAVSIFLFSLSKTCLGVYVKSKNSVTLDHVCKRCFLYFSAIKKCSLIFLRTIIKKEIKGNKSIVHVDVSII